MTAPDDAPQCSAKGCRRPASWTLSWRNPRIHTPDRRKQWLACDEHREHLADFLASRGFPLEVSRRDVPPPPAEPAATDRDHG